MITVATNKEIDKKDKKSWTISVMASSTSTLCSFYVLFLFEGQVPIFWILSFCGFGRQVVNVSPALVSNETSRNRLLELPLENQIS